MTRDPVTVACVVSGLLLVVSLPPQVIAAALILALLATLTIAIWRDIRPLWNADAERVEDTTPQQEREP